MGGFAPCRIPARDRRRRTTMPALASSRSDASVGKSSQTLGPPGHAHEDITLLIYPPLLLLLSLAVGFPDVQRHDCARGLGSSAGNGFSSRSRRSVTTHWRSDGSEPVTHLLRGVGPAKVEGLRRKIQIATRALTQQCKVTPLLRHPVAPLDVRVLPRLARVDPLHRHAQPDQPRARAGGRPVQAAGVAFCTGRSAEAASRKDRAEQGGVWGIVCIGCGGKARARTASTR